MTRTMGFGGKAGTICQMAYTVKDMDEAIEWWIRKMGVGPWFYLPRFGGKGMSSGASPAPAMLPLR